MHKYLLVFLILIFTPYTSNSYEDKPILLDRSYIRVGYGLNMVPDINNVKQQGEGLYSIDQTFPNALFDMKFEQDQLSLLLSAASLIVLQLRCLLKT